MKKPRLTRRRPTRRNNFRLVPERWGAAVAKTAAALLVK